MNTSNSAFRGNETVPLRLTVVGAGRVARSLARTASAAGLPVAFAVRNPQADTLCGCPCRALDAIDTETDLVVIAVSDDAIPEVSARIADRLHPGTVVCHTSGSSALELLAAHPRRGIFYPLRSFTGLETPEAWRSTPVLTEASDPGTLELLNRVAARVSSIVWPAGSEQRARLHLAAVFANNFTTCLLDCSARLMRQADLPFNLLRPLVLDSVRDIMDADEEPAQRQTGPAVRGDRQTLERHRALLKDAPDLAAVYDLLTLKIQNDHGKL